MPLTERILFGAFIFGIIGLFTVVGVLTPGVGWFLYFFLIPFRAMFPIIIIGTKGTLTSLITYLIAYPAAKLMLKKTPWYQKAAMDLRTKGHASIGGFSFSSGAVGRLEFGQQQFQLFRRGRVVGRWRGLGELVMARMLSRGTSGLLQEIRVQKTCSGLVLEGVPCPLRFALTPF